METPNFIDLPNGDSIRPASIVAVRLTPCEGAQELSPSVVIEYHAGDKCGCIALRTESIEERDVLAKWIRSQLG
jgi:hypothetical protein